MVAEIGSVLSAQNLCEAATCRVHALQVHEVATTGGHVENCLAQCSSWPAVAVHTSIYGSRCRKQNDLRDELVIRSGLADYALDTLNGPVNLVIRSMTQNR